MRKKFNAGEMRTMIVVKGFSAGKDADNFDVSTFTPLFGGEAVPCKWVNVFGRDVYEAARLNLREAATLTMRYSAQINARCKIWKSGTENEPAAAYEIISIDDMQDRHELLEIKVQRTVSA